MCNYFDLRFSACIDAIPAGKRRICTCKIPKPSFNETAYVPRE
jgi:hypothetical protein